MPDRRTLLGLLGLGARITARALRTRRKALSLQDRLSAIPAAGLPVQAPVRIRWNNHQIPYVLAEHDRDLAVGLGVVHAHLRLTQIEFMRRAAWGRLAEVLGPAAVQVDHMLRILNVPAALPGIMAGMPAETREWLEGFRDGINHVIANAPELPEEFRLLDFRPEPWSMEDLVALSRLAATDFTWKVWVPLLKLAGRPDWLKLWERMVGEDAIGVPSFAGGGLPGLNPALLDSMPALLGLFSRSGSNSVAVAAGRTAGGGAMIASDPHLGITLPNLWLLAGMKSPGHNAVGLMIPGVPVIGLGRNPRIAWGGTSLHAASSELVEVPAGTPLQERREVIRVRGGKPVAVTVRSRGDEPIISDAPLLPTRLGRVLALRWVGHRVSDELTSLLSVSRAADWEGFLSALEGYAVPALTMIYADQQGRVGTCMAAHLPRRPTKPPPDLVLGAEADEHWERMASVRNLPHCINPDGGVVASANDRPKGLEWMAVGWFFSPDDRVARLHELTGGGKVDGLVLRKAQRDVLMRSAIDIRDRLLALATGGAAATDPARDRLVGLLRDWDGHFTVEAEAPVALELLVYHLLRELHGKEDLDIYTHAWEPWALLRQDLAGLSAARLARAMKPAVQRTCKALDRHQNWGRMHRLRLRHPLGALPLVGKRYRFADVPAAGSNETLMKTAHGFSSGRHAVKLGAVARHISDLADPDCNDFCLLGGQDGFLGSSTFFDQFALWQEGRYIRLPLRPDTAEREMPHLTVLRPAGA
ncbi:penicillin acylase family protein [Indioceanicola profundi]|uniref:penicillin acylase family protein n=1 Tax=Indioceanicola profundi TaxID=2220096 RepID=UPI000E6ABE37|nr:penicillin acylase family protein [Indioceanicola profundi]